MTTPNNARHGVTAPFARSTYAAAPNDRESAMSREEFLIRFRRVREASNLDEWRLDASDKTHPVVSRRLKTFQDALSKMVKRLTRRIQSFQDVSRR